MKKGIISSLLSIVIILSVIVTFNMRGPDLSQYQHLKEPAISIKPSQRVLEVEAKGVPGETAKKAFGLLMRTYFGIKGSPRGKSMPSPKARWAGTADIPQSEWIGRYAMVIPDTLKDIKLKGTSDGLNIRVTSWDYGEVAEVLYTGPYDKETETIKRLHDFIAQSGYEIAGDHEEEYLRGPGMFIPGKPDKYVTIIRYPVKKKMLQDEIGQQ